MLSVSAFLTTWLVLCSFHCCCQHSQATCVTVGSVVKLLNIFHGVRLNSQDLPYPGGSKQQMVTGIFDEDDVHSHWVVRSVGDSMRGQPIRCGDLVRLEHLSTAKNLHSHNVRSPLSRNQEVSAFGENGIGDRGDTWQVMCKKLLWRRDIPVNLRHQDTGRFLMVSGHEYSKVFPQTYGHLEVAASRLDEQAYWEAAEGIYIHSSKKMTLHSEL